MSSIADVWAFLVGHLCRQLIIWIAFILHRSLETADLQNRLQKRLHRLSLLMRWYSPWCDVLVLIWHDSLWAWACLHHFLHLAVFAALAVIVQLARRGVTVNLRAGRFFDFFYAHHVCEVMDSALGLSVGGDARKIMLLIQSACAASRSRIIWNSACNVLCLIIFIIRYILVLTEPIVGGLLHFEHDGLAVARWLELIPCGALLACWWVRQQI